MDEEQKDDRNFFSRFGESFVDAAAQNHPLFAAIRGGVQTQGWKNEQKLKNLVIQEKQNKLDEWNADAPIREKTRKLALDSFDQDMENKGISTGRDKLKEQLSQNPGFARLNLDEASGYLNSPATTAMLRSKFYLDKVLGMAAGNKDDYDFLDRAMRRGNVKLVDGENGIKNLVFPNGVVIPATKEKADELYKNVSEGAAKEMLARITISESHSEENPVNRSVANYAKSFMQFNNGEAYRALERVERIVKRSTEPEKNWHFINRAIKDYSNPGLSSEVKLNGLAQTIPILKKLGYSVDGFDPKNPLIESVKIHDPKNKREMSFWEFSEIARDNDNLSRTLDKEIGLAEEAAIMKQNKEYMFLKGEQSKRADAAMKLRELAIKEQKAAKEDGEGSVGTGDEREEDKKADSMSLVSSGKDFVREHNLGNAVEHIWKNSEKNKNIKSRSDIFAVISNAKDAAEEVYTETGNYEDAQKAFADKMAKFGIAKDLIPNVWGDNALQQENAELKNKYKKLLVDYNKNQRDKEYHENKFIPGSPAGATASPPVAISSMADRNRRKRDEIARKINENEEKLRMKREDKKRAQQRAEERRKKFKRGEL